MKRLFLLTITALLCGFLSACSQAPFQPGILVSLAETTDYYIEENGIRISPGEDVCFTVYPAPGVEITGIDYSGTYYIWKENGAVKVKLKDVRFPLQAIPEITRYYRSISYDPNGGDGTAATVTYDTSLHTRPNTSIGSSLFDRKSFTLTSWNTAPDGSGTRVGLGSRVTVPQEGLTLYAQWEQWSDPANFSCATEDGCVRILRYLGTEKTVVIPARVDGLPVTGIAAGAFAETSLESVILPNTLVYIEDGAFDRSALESILLFDNLESFSDAAFSGCGNLKTLYINAVEAPYGYTFRRESMYADKVDMLIDAQGQKKAVFFAGCSMWYNLNGQMAQNALPDYRVINMGLNGTVNGYIQLQILSAFLEPGDIFFHTPELSSDQQFLTVIDMDHNADILWAGLENNYDLVSLVDIRGIGNFFGSFRDYLNRKSEETTYLQQYLDKDGNAYLDSTGSLPFDRIGQTETLPEEETIHLDPAVFQNRDLSLLRHFYEDFSHRGIHVYVSYACLLYTSVPEEQKGNLAAVENLLRSDIDAMDGPVLVSTLWDFLYEREEFYNSAYHLQAAAADANTAIWLRDLCNRMRTDGLLE